MALFKNEPLVIAQITGNSLVAKKPVAFSALTAKSSPRIPAVFLVAILPITATSSINAAISSKRAKNPEAINCYLNVSGAINCTCVHFYYYLNPCKIKRCNCH